MRGGLVKALMQLLGTTLPGEVFLREPVPGNGRSGVLGALLAAVEAERGTGAGARRARRANARGCAPWQHVLARAVSPLALKAACAELLCSLTEGVTDDALVELVVAAVDVDLVRCSTSLQLYSLLTY